MRINSFVPSEAIFNDNSIKKAGSDNKVNSSESFMDVLKNKLDGVNDKQVEAETTTQKFIQGDDVDVHQVMLSSTEAKLSLDLAVQVRNKLVEAYQELNRMQL